jgi:trigger factor
MKTQLQELPENRVRLVVEVPVEDVDHAFEHALSDLAAAVRIPGFRKGKAPKALIRQRVGSEALQEEALEGHLSGWYQRAVAVAGIDPVERPAIDWDDAPAEGSTFSFSAEVAVKPKPEVTSYKGLEGIRPPVEVPEEAVTRELERLQLSVAELSTVERAAEEGDFVVIDFAGSVAGKEFEGGKGTDYGVELGGGRLLPDLERGVVGMKARDERDVTVAFPLDYPAEHLAGKQAVFHVTVKDVKERSLPELDDEFAMSVSEFDTIAELRADIEDRFRGVIEEESRRAFRSSVLDRLAGRLSTPIPEPMVRNRMSEMTRNLIDQLASRGLTTEQYLRLTGQSSEDLVAGMRPQAEDAVAKDLVLEAVADAEGIEISDEQVESWIREQAAEAEEDAEGAVERLMGDPATLTALRADLRLQKALDVVVDNAKEITPEQADARARLWTPEQESSAASAKPSTIWTPGSAEPAES